jgi:hypothetical protein
MRRISLILILLLLTIPACQGPPPTQIILVVTATPESTTSTASPTANDEAPTGVAEETEEPEETAEATASTTLTPTQTPASGPTPVVSTIQVAEQVFEDGRMFWVQPTNQIWVIIIDKDGQGTWEVYEDTFVEGELELDESLVPPDGFQQPVRGFGKLWRENPEIREALGWATTPEFGFVTRYEYHGDADSGLGYHVLSTLYGETFRFNEADQTWQLGR